LVGLLPIEDEQEIWWRTWHGSGPDRGGGRSAGRHQRAFAVVFVMKGGKVYRNVAPGQ